ncbi:MAG TPA: hypothetical protein VFN51_01170 [Candidatus Saccharimonadales bacterium]|nr:hypothetical protein [Candidatus Saccharimonadales bacterium]
MSLIRKKKTEEVSPRRQRPGNNERMDVSRTFAYRSRRSEEAFNTGRTLETATPRSAKKSLLSPRFLALGGLLIFLVVALDIISLSTNVNIIPLNSSKNISLTSTEKTQYQLAAKKYLSGSVLNRNKLTVDTQGLSRYLAASYPEISSVNPAIPLLSDTMDVYIGLAQPALILDESDGAYAVDDAGRVMFKLNTSELQSMSSIPAVVDQSGLSARVNDLVLPASEVSFIQEIVGQLKAKGMLISSMTLPSGEGELDARVAGEAYFIKFNLENNDPRQQAGTYLATIAQLKSEGITPGQYIDVRVDGRAYYK